MYVTRVNHNTESYAASVTTTLHLVVGLRGLPFLLLLRLRKARKMRQQGAPKYPIQLDVTYSEPLNLFSFGYVSMRGSLETLTIQL